MFGILQPWLESGKVFEWSHVKADHFEYKPFENLGVQIVKTISSFGASGFQIVTTDKQF